jgi:MFS family permease
VVAFSLLIVRRVHPNQGGEGKGVRDAARRLRTLVKKHPAMRAYFVANALWEMSLAALKAFIVVYLTVGLHYRLASTSLMIGGAAVVILIGAAGAGKLGDRFGRVRVVRIALIGCGVGFLMLVLHDQPAADRARSE